jgi:putative membrane protein
MDLGDPSHPEGEEQTPPQRSSVDVRQQLAADRTLLAWIRTSIALAGLGFVVSKFNLFLHEIRGAPTSSSLASRTLGLALVAVGACAVLLGLIQHRQVARILSDDGDPMPAPRWPAVVAAVGSLLGLLALSIYLASEVH